MSKINNKVAGMLIEKGDIGLKDLSEYVGRSIPSVRNAKNTVLEQLDMKVCGLVDYEHLSRINSKIILSIIGISLSVPDIDIIIDKITKLAEVNWVCHVSGKYNLLVQILSTRGATGIRDVLNSIKKFDGISLMDSFVVLSSRKKLMRLPDGLTQKLKIGEEMIF